MEGFGRASKPVGGVLGPARLAEGTVDFIRRENLRDLVIVGHSLGGGVALLTALRLRELGEADRLKGMVLVSAASLPQPLPRFMKLGRVPGLGAIGIRLIPPTLLIRVVLRLIVHDRTRVNPESAREYAWALRGRDGKRSALNALRGLVPDDLAELAERYAEITTPVLALWGREDRVVRLEVGEELVRRLPQARLAVLDRCGHVLPEEWPEQGLEEVGRFLTELDQDSDVDSGR